MFYFNISINYCAGCKYSPHPWLALGSAQEIKTSRVRLRRAVPKSDRCRQALEARPIRFQSAKRSGASGPLYAPFETFDLVVGCPQNRAMSLNITHTCLFSYARAPKANIHLPIQPDISCATDTITCESLSILEISSNLSMLLLSSPCGAMVQRLARGPFKAEMRVRFPLALPIVF